MTLFAHALHGSCHKQPMMSSTHRIMIDCQLASYNIDNCLVEEGYTMHTATGENSP